MSNYRQCNRCVMDTSDPDIFFDDNGYCNHCNNYFDRISRRTYKSESSDKQLQTLVEVIKHKGKRKRYDCVLGVSGGIDSSYAAYKLKQLGIRTLLVHMDNGWNSETSIENIKSLADKLGFDYENVVLDWATFSELQLSFLKASVPEIEIPTDIAIPAVLHKIASKYNIKHIISGGNFATEGILPKAWSYNAKDLTYLKHIQKTFGTKKINRLQLFGWRDELYYKLIRGIRIIYILNYMPFEKDMAMQVLESELNWKYYGGKHYESKYTGFVQSYILPVKFNIDYRRATLSTTICSGEITRENALEILKELPYNIEKTQTEIEYVCKKLCISITDFNEIMKQPPKLYRDYPNAEKKLEHIYNIYRKLFRKPNYR